MVGPSLLLPYSNPTDGTQDHPWWADGAKKRASNISLSLPFKNTVRQAKPETEVYTCKYVNTPGNIHLDGMNNLFATDVFGNTPSDSV